ncbi:alpha/beta hydrolase [Sphingomonas soli]|uniref:alpha/beta hydrolase n=1 Tax=Sphingomonas soli TaxID=266127 RepID=UPI00082D389C|nr:alpha/beta fold hydrolase [Sphingomonas soli]
MMRLALLAAAVAAPLQASSDKVAPVEVTAPGPDGPLAGTLLDPGAPAPAILILPGSGPTDRDGNNPLGVAAASYRLLAEGLAERGIATLRIDKRGSFGSKAAATDPNAVTISDYANDARAWVDMLRKRSGRACVWLLGHSEGGLVAMTTAHLSEGICGVILVASPGRPLAGVMREQLRANPANAPILDAALSAIDSLEAGRRVDSGTLPGPLKALFAPQVQGFIIDLFSHRPAELAASLKVPLLVVQGDRDIQVAVEDAKMLADAAKGSTLAVLPNVNHVLKAVASEERAANLATYVDPSLPLAPGVVETIAGFVTAPR